VKRIGLCLLSIIGFTASAFAQFTIENPQPDSTQSGIGLISAWKCTGKNLTAVIDGIYTLALVYGSDRLDTQGTCGDTNNGIGLLVNWNLLSNGQHTIEFFDNGVKFASVSFTVQTLGSQFLTGKSKTVTVSNFPNSGQTTTLKWSESAQNFLITGLSEGGGGYPNVSGQWGVSLDFVTEDCNFLSVPPDLPTHLSGSLSVMQSGGDLTIQSGIIIFEGDLQTDGEFSVVADPTIDTVGSCTFAIVEGYAGNFLDGDVIFLLAATKVSGSCIGVTLPCGVLYAGDITKQSSATQLLSTETPITTIKAKIREALQ
jgi:hypothetical protein